MPESLAFAYAYLRIGFPDARCLIIEDAGQTQEDWWQGYDFVFCPMQLYGTLKFPAIDLGFSVWNLGETRQECIDYFFEGINGRIDFRRFIFWNNCFVNTDLLEEASGDAGEGSLMTLKFGPQWRPRGANFQSMRGYLWENFQLDIFRNNLLVLMEKVTETDANLGWSGDGPIYDVIRKYCRALWSKDANDVEEFCAALERFLSSQVCATAPTYRFDEIGEVRFLRRAAEAS